MDSSLLTFLEQFTNNLTACGSVFKSNYGCEKVVAALIHLSKGTDVNLNKLNNCKNIIKESLKFYHPFRGLDSPIITSYMATADNQDEYLHSALKALDSLKSHFPMYNLVATTAIAMESIPQESIVTKFNALKGVSQYFGNKYPLLQKSDKLPAMLLLTMTDNANVSIKHVETLHSLLKQHYRFHAMSYALALAFDSKDDEEKARDLRIFINAAKQREIPFDNNHAYSQVVGFLSLVPISNKAQFFSDIDEVSKWMASNGAYGFKNGLYKGLRHNLAALLLLYYYASLGDTQLEDYATMCTYAFVNGASQQALAQQNAST